MIDSIINWLNMFDDFLYYPVLIIVLAAAGVYFSLRSRFAQIRLCSDAVRILSEHPAGLGGVSPIDALMVSTASIVGTGNIIGVSTAICLGGPGAVFWMWVMAILGGASSLIESTLAQIFKQKDPETERSYGGPAYYIEAVIHSKPLAVMFSVFLIATYGFGFNALASYNLQSTFAVYDFYNPKVTPLIIGAVIALLVGWCLLGGAMRIVNIAGFLVPLMITMYIATSLMIILMHINKLPEVLRMIFSDAFNFRAIGSGIAGSCLVYGIKRGLYSNEAGVGAAPNAAAYANTQHPVKQGIIQMLSVYIDTILICTATAFLCLISGVPSSPQSAGAQYVQASMMAVFGEFGPVFITAIMVLFAFTTLLGNLFYVDNALVYLNGKRMPSKKFMMVFRVVCALVILAGAALPMSMVWAVADITMAGMTLLNIPVLMIGGGIVFRAIKDYEKQRRAGVDPVFRASEIGLDPERLSYWQ
ncbi:MAG: alanine:cation symporter family protein [Synergistaceae bacterium]|nr:alanine:cation symporter family protein [Synergistaceae bacterium]